MGDLLFVIELNVSNGESQREKLVSRKVVAVVFGCKARLSTDLFGNSSDPFG